MTLYTIQLTAIALSVIAVLVLAMSAVLWLSWYMKNANLQDVRNVTEARITMRDGKSSIDTSSGQTGDEAALSLSRVVKWSRLLRFMGLIFCASAMTAILTFCWFNHMALQHGAFGDYLKTETIDSVRDRSAHMFVDQSKELPDDLSGSLLIFFKYTCSDCYDTHHQIMEVLDKEGADNVWFVSSASENGPELVSRYGVEAVPWGVYVDKDGSVGMTEILYDEFESEPDKKFIEANLTALINLQKGDTP